MSDKEVLKEYIDACKLIEETEKAIRRLKRRKKTIAYDKVSGSNPEFPYNPQRFNIAGSEYTYEDDILLRSNERLLVRQKERAAQIKEQAEDVILNAPLRIQRIIGFKYRDGLSWDETAAHMGRGSTADSLRKELDRFLEKN